MANSPPSQGRLDLLGQVTEHYLGSHDFNGLPLDATSADRTLIDALAGLVADGLVDLNFGDVHPNPFIRAFPPEANEVQLTKLAGHTGLVCAYPSQTYLASVVRPSDYEGRPFTLRLALGAPQLEFVPFDLSVLEKYRNDPRYYYTNDDIGGTISIHDQYYLSEAMPERDQVLLQTFGFAYDHDLNRAVIVFLCYLSGLSPEHQQIWNAQLIDGDYSLHPAYYQSSILGRFWDGMPICDAIIEELRQVNLLCGLIGRPHLFRMVPAEGRPRDFCFLIRPTLREYQAFISVLDKLFSANIDKKFFLEDVPLTSEEAGQDGKVRLRQKGTIQILEDWLNRMWRSSDDAPVEEMLATLRDVRKLRQRPAHAIDEDRFDQDYLKQQRALLIRGFRAMQVLIRILAKHPDAQSYTGPAWLESGRIYDH